MSPPFCVIVINLVFENLGPSSVDLVWILVWILGGSCVDLGWILCGSWDGSLVDVGYLGDLHQCIYVDLVLIST